eukprot:4491765-Amphidinium_carterae.1
MSGRSIVYLGHDHDQAKDVVEYVCDALELQTSRGHLIHEGGEVIPSRALMEDWPFLKEPGEVNEYQLAVH